MADTRSEAPLARLCSRQGCKREALYTLTYVYADSTAVVGPLSMHNEPHAYDLCEVHAQRMTAPRGWEVLRVEVPGADQETQAASHATVTSLAPLQDREQAMQPSADAPVAGPPRAAPVAVPAPAPRPAAAEQPPAPVRQPVAVPAQPREPDPESSLEQSDDGENSLVDEIFFHQDLPRERTRDATPAQPRGMRRPHLRRRPRSDS